MDLDLKKKLETELWLHESKLSPYLLSLLEARHTPLDKVYSTLLAMAPKLSQNEYVHHSHRSALFDQIFAQYQFYYTQFREKNEAQSFFNAVQKSQEVQNLSARASSCEGISMDEFEVNALAPTECVQQTIDPHWMQLFEKANASQQQTRRPHPVAPPADVILRLDKEHHPVNLNHVAKEASAQKLLQQESLYAEEEQDVTQPSAQLLSTKRANSSSSHSVAPPPILDSDADYDDVEYSSNGAQKIRRISRKSRQPATSDTKSPKKSPKKSPRKTIAKSPKKSPPKSKKRPASTQLAPEESKKSKSSNTKSTTTTATTPITTAPPQQPEQDHETSFRNSYAALKCDKGYLYVTQLESSLGRSSRSTHIDHDLTKFDAPENLSTRAKLSRRQAMLKIEIENEKVHFRLRNVGKLAIFKVLPDEPNQSTGGDGAGEGEAPHVNYEKIQTNDVSELHSGDRVVFPIKRTFKFVVNEDKVKSLLQSKG